MIEECCKETCDYKERSNLAGKYGSGEAFGDALWEVSSLGRRSCKCRAKEGHMYDCGRSEDCADKTCKCDGNAKDPNWWKVTNVTYYDSGSTLKRRVVTANSHTVDNLSGQVEITPKFIFSTSLTETESSTLKSGTSVELGTKFTAGVPDVSSFEISATRTISKTRIFGQKVIKTETRTVELPCPAPKRKFVVCEGRMDIVKAVVPYKMTIKHKYYGCTCTSTGIYEGENHTGIYLKSTTFSSKPKHWLK